MNASRDAFLFSVEKLFEETGKLYFWTITFRKVQDDDVAMKSWADAMVNGYRIFKGVHGLRVIELHEQHGIHFHLLLNQRFPVRRMLSLLWPFGFGIINVKTANLGAGRYLAKYLTKQYKNNSYFSKRRRWGAFGGFKPSRCKDMEYDTAYQRNKLLLNPEIRTGQGQHARMKRLLFAAMCRFGDYAEWPEPFKQQFASWNN